MLAEKYYVVAARSYEGNPQPPRNGSATTRRRLRKNRTAVRAMGGGVTAVL
jgi:hypothetical protein